MLLAGCDGAPVVRPAQIDSYVPQYAAAMSQLEFIGTAGTPENTQTLAEVAAKGISQGSMAGPQPIPDHARICLIAGISGNWRVTRMRALMRFCVSTACFQRPCLAFS